MPKQKQFIIQDWAGNVLLNGQTFKTFEDAWDFILGDLTDLLKLTEEDYEDYYVIESYSVRSTRYLEPNDSRGGLRNDSQ